MGRHTNSDTYEILKTKIDHTARTIEMTCVHALHPITIKFEVDHGLDVEPPIIGQIFKPFVSMFGTEGGEVTSADTAYGYGNALRRFVHVLIDGGLLDANDKAFTADAVRQQLEPVDPNVWTVLLRATAAAVEATKRFDRLDVGESIRNTPIRYQSSTDGTVPYEPGEAEAVIAAAQLIIKNHAEQHKTDLDGLAAFGDFDVNDRQWLTVTAEQFIKASKKRSPQAVKRQLPATTEELEDWSDEEIFDHLVVNGPEPLKGGRRHLPTRLRVIGNRLYPTWLEHGAWAVQNCVADLRGLNLSVMVGVSADDVESFGDDGVVIAFAKARNRRLERIPAIAQGFTSLGGLQMLMLSRTALQRHHLGKDGNPASQKLYLDAATGKIYKGANMGQVRKQRGWRLALEEVAPESSVERVSFKALRLWALEHGIKKDPFHDVAFHTQETRIDYLRNLVNDATLQEAVSNAVAEATAKASEAVMSESLVQLKTALDDDTAVDLAHTVCSSGQTLPDEPDTPCAQGPLACFGCKCGYRGAGQLPGVVSLHALAERLLKDRPHDVEAALLKEVTRLTLNEFPEAQVERVKETLDPAVSSLVWHLYAAHRRSASNG